MAENEAVDVSCSVYQAEGSVFYDQKCSPMQKCRTCEAGKSCSVPKRYPVYGVEEYGMV